MQREIYLIHLMVKKILNKKTLINLSKDKLILEIFKSIFPQLKYINEFSKNNSYVLNSLDKVDFIFLISLLTVDETDNVDYFLYKYNLSKKDQKRIKDIDNFYKNKLTSKDFIEKKLNKIFYYKGREAILDILNYKIFKSKKIDNDMVRLIKFYKDKKIPEMPVKADLLMSKYNISEGKLLGKKLKIIEEEWVNNNFQISDQQVEMIINN